MSNKEAKALPFIINQPNGEFMMTKEAEDFIAGLKSRRLGVICVAGKYRTGKSYFLNKVLLGNKCGNRGFSVGSTINSCTKGLWIWNRIIPASTFGGDEGLDLLVIDSEGLAGIDESANHDNKIFVFALVLSSFFIYNSRGHIDEAAIENLTLILDIAKNIKIKTGGFDSQSDLASTFPSFLWVIRDFMLEMKSKTGEQMTSSEYLEKALEEVNGLSDQINKKNKIRRHFKQFFQQRDCQTMVIPTNQNEDLKRMEFLEDWEIRPEFLSDVTECRKKIFKKAKSKNIGGIEMNGCMLLEVVKEYIQAVNSGKVPVFDQVWSYATKEADKKSYNETIKELDLAFEIEEASDKLFDTDKKEAFQNKILNFFDQRAVRGSEQSKLLRKKLSDELNQ